MVWITTGKSLYVTQKQMTHKHVWHETVIHMWQTTAHDTQAFLTWNSCPCVANNRNDIQSCLAWNSYPHVANNSKWHTNMSICGKQQQMTYSMYPWTETHVWHETVVHMWQTTANDIQSFLTWNICPYVTNNSKWHTSIWHETVYRGKQQQMTHMKQLSICGKQQQMTHKHVGHETVIMWQTIANDIQSFLTWNSCPYVTNNSKWHTSILTWNSYPSVANNSKWHRSIFDMKQLSICNKQQQMTHKHVWHETVIHMWQTTANDTRAFLTWKSYPYVATTAKDIQSCLTWNSYPYVANNSKWHTNMFAMKQLSICGKQQQMTQKHFWHETVVHM